MSWYPDGKQRVRVIVTSKEQLTDVTLPTEDT